MSDRGFFFTAGWACAIVFMEIVEFLAERLQRCKMGRLTKRISLGNGKFTVYFSNEKCGEFLTNHKAGVKALFEKLAEYEDLEEQGKILELKQVSVNDVVDKLFSHNEIISLWREERENGISVHKRIWYGMAWDIPEELKKCTFVKIFGTIPESIVHADIINIEVVLSEEAEKALAEMEKQGWQKKENIQKRS